MTVVLLEKDIADGNPPIIVRKILARRKLIVAAGVGRGWIPANFHLSGKKSQIRPRKFVAGPDGHSNRTRVSNGFIVGDILAAAFCLPPAAFFGLRHTATELHPGILSRQ